VNFIFSEADLPDIGEMHEVRMSVKENMLSNPALISHDDYENFLRQRGKGWVCRINEMIVGFTIVDLVRHNVWALFVRPGFEGQGIGRRLHYLMVDWYFNQSASTLWLSTAPETRAALFYERAGWKQAGNHGKEIKFEMTWNDWQQRKERLQIE